MKVEKIVNSNIVLGRGGFSGDIRPHGFDIWLKENGIELKTGTYRRLDKSVIEWQLFVFIGTNHWLFDKPFDVKVMSLSRFAVQSVEALWEILDEKNNENKNGENNEG
jgi:hypothetical protein